MVDATLAEQCDIAARHCLRLEHRRHFQVTTSAAQGDDPARARAVGGGDGSTTRGGQRGEVSDTEGRVAETLAHSGEHEEPQRQADAGMGHGSVETDLHDQVTAWPMAQTAAATGGDWWSARHYVSLLTRTPQTPNTRRTDGRRWASCGSYDSLVTSGHGRSADGNGGYDQPVATTGHRTHT